MAASGWAAGLLLLCAVLPFAETRNYPHVHDDHELRGVGSLVRDERTDARLLWTADFFGTVDQPRGQTGFWRPLILLTFRLEHHLAGASEAGYLWLGHTLTILCHAAAALALWRLLLALDLPAGAAVVAAAAFAAHPVQVETVAWASGRVASLPTALAFGATAAWLGRRGQGPWVLGVVTLGFTLALLCKETAIVLVGLAAVLGRLAGLSWPRALAAPGAGVALALLLRASLFGLGREIDPLAYTGPEEALTRWLTWLAVLPDLLRLLLWAGPATPLHPVAAVTSWADPRALVGVVVLVALAVLAVWAVRRQLLVPSLVALLVVGSLLVLAPWARYPVGFTDVAGPLYDRYAYAMVAAPCALGAWLLRGRLASRGLAPLLVAAIVATPLGLLTSRRVSIWASDEAFARAGLAVAPGSSDLLNHLGYALLVAHTEGARPGAAAEALATLERALVLTPDHRLANLNRFLVLRLLGRDAEADVAASSLLARWPDDPHVLDNVAGFRAAQGRLGEAIELFEREIATGRPLPGAAEALRACVAAREQG